MRKEVPFLGHIVSKDGIKTDPEKIAAIEEFPRPRDLTQVQSFVSLAGYYRKFIKKFTDIARPLYQLTRKDIPFHWSPECETAFITLKDKLKSAPILQPPDFKKDFIITSDASGYAIGAVLSQLHDGVEKPVAYFSKSLNKAQKNYSTIEKECLAIHEAVK